MRDLILDFTYSQGSSLLPTYDFDGGKKWQGIQSVVISGFLMGDALKDNITTVGSTASLLNGDGKAEKDNIVANDNNTVTVNFFANNAGTYRAHIEISEAIRNNYRFVKQSDAGFPGSLSPSTNSYEWDASWTINKHVITLENLTITPFTAGKTSVITKALDEPLASIIIGLEYVEEVVEPLELVLEVLSCSLAYISSGLPSTVTITLTVPAPSFPDG